MLLFFQLLFPLFTDVIPPILAVVYIWRRFFFFWWIPRDFSPRFFPPPVWYFYDLVSVGRSVVRLYRRRSIWLRPVRLDLFRMKNAGSLARKLGAVRFHCFVSYQKDGEKQVREPTTLSNRFMLYSGALAFLSGNISLSLFLLGRYGAPLQSCLDSIERLLLMQQPSFVVLIFILFFLFLGRSSSSSYHFFPFFSSLRFAFSFFLRRWW